MATVSATFVEHLGIWIERSRSCLAVDFGDGIIGFRLPDAAVEEGAAKSGAGSGEEAGPAT